MREEEALSWQQMRIGSEVGPNWNNPSLRPLYTPSFLPAAKPTGRRTVRVVVFLAAVYQSTTSDDTSASETIQRWDPETRLNFFSLTPRLHTPSLIIL